MTRVRMLIHRTGGRYDGQEWPGYLDIIDVPHWEAENLVAEGHAELPDAPLLNRGYDVLKAADVDYAANLKRVDGTEEEVDPRYVHRVEEKKEVPDFDNDFDDDDSVNDFEDEPEIKLPRPKQQDNKQAWVDYVVNQGYVSYGDAKNMTKNALMEMDS